MTDVDEKLRAVFKDKGDTSGVTSNLSSRTERVAATTQAQTNDHFKLKDAAWVELTFMMIGSESRALTIDY
eukprot:6205849-Pleurochrysis_carterae.AAC.2